MLIENFSQYPARRLEIQSALQFLMVHAWTPPKSKKDENCPTNELTEKKNKYAKKKTMTRKRFHHSKYGRSCQEREI